MYGKGQVGGFDCERERTTHLLVKVAIDEPLVKEEVAQLKVIILSNERQNHKLAKRPSSHLSSKGWLLRV